MVDWKDRENRRRHPQASKKIDTGTYTQTSLNRRMGPHIHTLLRHVRAVLLKNVKMINKVEIETRRRGEARRHKGTLHIHSLTHTIITRAREAEYVYCGLQCYICYVCMHQRRLKQTKNHHIYFVRPFRHALSPTR